MSIRLGLLRSQNALGGDFRNDALGTAFGVNAVIGEVGRFRIGQKRRVQVELLGSDGFGDRTQVSLHSSAHHSPARAAAGAARDSTPQRGSSSHTPQVMESPMHATRTLPFPSARDTPSAAESPHAANAITTDSAAAFAEHFIFRVAFIAPASDFITLKSP